MKKKDTEDLGIKNMKDYPPVKFVSSGIPAIDNMTGGFPMGRLTEIYGKKSVGKTTMMLMMLAAQSKKYKTLYCDVENALNVERFVELGGNPDSIDFSTNSVLEELAELILKSLPKYQIIILDSVAGATTHTELSSEVGNHLVGVKAKVLNSFISRRLPEALAKSGTALILINQLRDSFSMYGDKMYTPGGKAIEYAASLRIELNTLAADRITEGGQQIGHHVSAKITKSKISAPYQTARFKIVY